MHMLSQVLGNEQAQDKQLSTVDQCSWLAVLDSHHPKLCRHIKKFTIEVSENTCLARKNRDVKSLRWRNRSVYYRGRPNVSVKKKITIESSLWVVNSSFLIWVSFL